MKTKKRNYPYKEIALLSVIILSLIIISIISREFKPYIEQFLDIGIMGMVVYFIISILSIVLAPLNMLFLIPIATILWGPLITSILSIAGWTIGAQIALEIARKGKHILRKFVSMKNLEKFEKKMPTKSLFTSIIALRILIPVDILSYAIGFFIPINRVAYFFSTLIGVAPFAIIFSYVGTVSFEYKIILVITSIMLLFLSWIFLKNK